METYKLYNGSVILHFDPTKHLYTISKNGKEEIIYGVTSIEGMLSKPWMLPWGLKVAKQAIKDNLLNKGINDEILDLAFKEPNRISQMSRDVGTKAHELADKWFKSEKAEFTEELVNLEGEMGSYVRGCLKAFLKFIKTFSIQRNFGERKVYSKKYNYAGTLDFYGLVNDKNTIVDYKTSSAIYPSYFLQLAAYAHALEEELKIEVEQTMIVRLSKNGELQTQVDENWKNKLPVFLSLLKVYQWEMDNKTKKINDKS